MRSANSCPSSQASERPKFALVDANNKVVSFVSPGPGVELQAYVGQQIGVMGSKGYMPELTGQPDAYHRHNGGADDPTVIARVAGRSEATLSFGALQ